MREVHHDVYDRETGEQLRVVEFVEQPRARQPRERVFERYTLVSPEGWRRVRDGKLTKSDLTVWAELQLRPRMDDTFKITPKALIDHLGWTAARVQASLAHLVDVGLIDRVAIGAYAPNPLATWTGSGGGRKAALAERHPEYQKIDEPSAQEEDQ